MLRDAQRVYGRAYNPDVDFSILSQLAATLKDVEYAGLKNFKQTLRVVRAYLATFEDIFMIQKIPAHEESIGGDVWTFFNTGVLSYFAKGVLGEGLQLLFARILTINEILAVCEYSGKRLRPSYYKTARGSPIDLIWGDSLVKISNAKQSQFDYDLRPLRAAMSKLIMDRGYLLWGPMDLKSTRSILTARLGLSLGQGIHRATMKRRLCCTKGVLVPAVI